MKRPDFENAGYNVLRVFWNVISFGLFLSPWTFYIIVKNKSVEEFKVDPYLATVLNCIFWVLYGLPFVRPDSILVATINSVGLVLELIYTFFHDHKRRILAFGIVTSRVSTGHEFDDTGIVRRLVVDDKWRPGMLQDVFNIIMYSSPLTVMKKVITTKSVEYMPFYLSLANFLNGCMWTAYALIKLDIFVLVSNGLGALSGAVQLTLYGWYFRSTPRDEKVVELKASQIQLSISDGPDRV
ncbi:bidirectional sugar transporter SWEET6b-like [Eucalyptus grandis]|uniref:bidirectional sugar transporter SWEET6b-like n=1 Tax=Eucalyptus grandis TaxID=71139 RepID=UPI00192ED91B|nr:bidirectional sugar transporter SWEET6b-like [Eucalyptus grandis]